MLFYSEWQIVGEIFKKFIIRKGQSRLLPCTSLSMRGFWVEAPSKSTFDLQDPAHLDSLEVNCSAIKIKQVSAFVLKLQIEQVITVNPGHA